MTLRQMYVQQWTCILLVSSVVAALALDQIDGQTGPGAVGRADGNGFADPAGTPASDQMTTARPVQAALTSAVTFSVGAAMPLLMAVVSPSNMLVPVTSAASLGFLAFLGAVGAKAGGANMLRATIRVTFWGALALGITAGIGKLFGTVL